MLSKAAAFTDFLTLALLALYFRTSPNRMSSGKECASWQMSPVWSLSEHSDLKPFGMVLRPKQSTLITAALTESPVLKKVV